VNTQRQQEAGILVLMHDLSDRRPHYRDVLEFFESVEIVDSLMLMKPRSDFSPALGVSRLIGRQFDFT